MSEPKISPRILVWITGWMVISVLITPGLCDLSLQSEYCCTLWDGSSFIMLFGDINTSVFTKAGGIRAVTKDAIL